MERVPPSVRLAQLAAFVGVMYFAIQLAIHLGIEKKTWWQFSWEIITGGTLGAIAGVAFFVLVGAVGLVSGAMFGALGLLGPAAGGALGGLGLGALVHIANNPDRYNFNWPVITVVLILGLLIAKAVASAIASAAERRSNRIDIPIRDASRDRGA